MININLESPLDTILPFVKNWLALLAEGKLAEACNQLETAYPHDEVWTPERIVHIVRDTFPPESLFYQQHPEGPVFTNPYDLKEQKRYVDEWLQDWFDYELEYHTGPDSDGVIHFEYDIPLNGEWSDLTALFEFHKSDGGYKVVLRGLHVL